MKRPRGEDDIGGLDHALGGFGAKSGASGILVECRYFDAAADRGGDLFRIGVEILDDPLLGGKALRIDAGERQGGKSVVPRRTVGDERIPPLGAPALGNPVALDD